MSLTRWWRRLFGRSEAVALDSAGEFEALLLWRVQVLDALRCSQERSRMAGLDQRHDGCADGWDALQPERTGPAG